MSVFYVPMMIGNMAAGTVSMMEAALEGLTRPDGTRPLLIAVTQLTSTDQESMEADLLIKEPIDKVTESLVDYGKVVDEIIGGKWGNGQARWDKLAKSGYDWAHAQNLVNERLGYSKRYATNYGQSQEELAKKQEKVNTTTTDQILKLIKFRMHLIRNYQRVLL